MLDVESGRAQCCAGPTVELDPAYISVGEPIDFEGDGLTVARLFYAPKQPRLRADARRAAAARRHRSRRPDRARLDRARPRDAALHEPWASPSSTSTTAAAPATAANSGIGCGALGRGRRRGQRRRRALPRLVGRRRSGAHRDHGRQRRRVHDAPRDRPRDEFAAGATYYGVADLVSFHEERTSSNRTTTSTSSAVARREGDLRGPLAGEPRRLDLTAAAVAPGAGRKVVPPSQSEVIVDALKRRGVPYAYIAFEGEGHGFRKAENVKRSIEAHLSFLGQLFGFEPADDIEPIRLENLHAVRQ